MTIQFLAQWNGNEAMSIKTLAASEESRLVSAGIARVYTDSTDGGSGGIAIVAKMSLAGPVSLDDSSRVAVANSGAYEGIGGTILEIGDSLTDNGFFSEANGRGTVAQSICASAWAELGGPFKRFAAGGVSGENTEEILARVPGLLSAWNPSVVVFGPNSVNDMDDGFTSARTIAADTAAIDLALMHPSVQKVLIMTVHPTDSSNLETATGGGATRRKWYAAVNAHKRAKAANSNGRVMLIDFGGVVGKPDGSGPQANWSPDGAHMNFLGAAEASRLAVKPVVSKIKFASQWEMPASAIDHANMIGPGASQLQGDNASGSAGYLNSTGMTGQGPNGITARRFSGDSTSTGVASSIASPIGLGGKSAQLVTTIGQAGGGAGFAFGQENSALNRYDNARANSTVYTAGHRILVSATLCGQAFTATGTSAASSPDFTGVEPGDMVTDGTVVWLITKRPVAGMVVDVAVDCSILSVTGGAQVSTMLTIADGVLSYDRWINYAGTTTYAWPTTFDSSRRLLRQRFTIPSDLGSIRTFRIIPMVMGANGAVATLQVHRVSLTEAND